VLKVFAENNEKVKNMLFEVLKELTLKTAIAHAATWI